MIENLFSDKITLTDKRLNLNYDMYKTSQISNSGLISMSTHNLTSIFE